MVRFPKDCRDGVSWFANDVGEIVEVLATKPQASSDIYIVKVRGQETWATSEDFTIWNQLSLF